MRLILTAAVLHVVLASAQAQSQTIVYQWLNQPCSTNLNCNEGCSACDVPSNSSQTFFGSNMAWIGVDICPHPIATGSGDNAIYSYGWPTFPSNDVYAMTSGIAASDMQIDSIIIRHRSAMNGPQRLKVQVGTDPSAPMTEVADAEVPHTTYGDLVLTDLGCLTFGEAVPYGTFQLMVQPYQGNGGEWHLDEVRVVASACEEQVSIGILEHERVSQRKGTYYDVLGRPVGPEAAPGVYAGPKRVIRVL